MRNVIPVVIPECEKLAESAQLALKELTHPQQVKVFWKII